MSSGSEFHNLAAVTGKARSVAKCEASCSSNNQQRRPAIEALEARAPQTVLRLWSIVYNS